MTHSPMKTMSTMRAWFLICLGLVAAPGVAAQAPDFLVSSGREMSRADLQASLQRLDAAAVSEDYGEAVRQQAAARAAQIRQRLTEGDYRVGDRIQVQVQGEAWDADSPGAIQPVQVVPTPGSIAIPTGRGSTGATFAVQEGPAVKFPDIPLISLRGVLRSELQDHLTEELSAYIIDPVVEAETLLRIAVMGEVRVPGYYYPAATQNLGDLIMMAGGPAPSAEYDKTSLLRGGQPLWEGDDLQALIGEGRTLDQLNLQAGDIVEVPRESDTNIWMEVGRYALIVGSTLLLGIRVF
ncbi:polysaccharide biosynthesis/export family protein [Gaopeijia maritima]